MDRTRYGLVDRFARQQTESFKWFTHRWYYIEGVILKGYLDLAEATGEPRWRDYAKKYFDGLLDTEGSIIDFRWGEYNIDEINMGKVLFTLHEADGDPKYLRAAEKLYAHLKRFPRTNEGNFWHKDIYPYQVWLDGLYMGQPFLVRCVQRFDAVKDFSDTLRQFANVDRIMYDPDRRLYLHAYDESRAMFWADPRTGLSLNVWSRACGWHVMAMADVLELLADEDCDSSPLRESFRRAVDGLLEYQHESGMWYQVTDRGNRKGNYLESSGTLMISYAILKGVRLGLLPAEYAEAGKRAFDGCIGEKLIDKGGDILLTDICKSAGLGGEKRRPGTFDYYLSEDIVPNNGHGIGALLLAYAERLRSGA